MKRLIIALSVLVALLVGAWLLSRSRTFQLFGEIVARVETDRRVVALTFDDGPAPGAAEQVMATLAERGVKGTFFLIGHDLQEHPELGRMLAAAGHELGNHTWSHEQMVLKSPSFIEREIVATDSLIRLTGYAGPIRFRPPFCKKLIGLPWFLSRTGRVSITWDVEPDSYPEVASDPALIVRHVLDHASPGSIILLHVMYPSRDASLRAVGPLIDSLKGRGYTFATVSELMAMR
jgi:peptidoglycan/xylan/chitin deacetylase (PgdA/CDA1 family)